MAEGLDTSLPRAEARHAPAAPSGLALLRALRPKQWAKNVLVVPAPAAAGVLGHGDVIGKVALAFVSFCLVSSATYLVNDVRDLESDRRHPTKRRRSIAAGQVSVPVALSLGAAPDVMINSAHAVTEDGQIVVTSASGSQIGPIASGAGQLILVIGSQKIVPDLDTAFRRIREHVFPYEDARLREAIGIGTKITRTLILDQDFMPGRTTVILVRTPIGV